MDEHVDVDGRSYYEFIDRHYERLELSPPSSSWWGSYFRRAPSRQYCFKDVIFNSSPVDWMGVAPGIFWHHYGLTVVFLEDRVIVDNRGVVLNYDFQGELEWWVRGKFLTMFPQCVTGILEGNTE